jgi:hypothetical protein
VAGTDVDDSGTAGALVLATHRLPSTSHVSSAPQHRPIDAPAQHVVPVGQQDADPLYDERAWQHVEPSLQQKA